MTMRRIPLALAMTAAGLLFALTACAAPAPAPAAATVSPSPAPTETVTPSPTVTPTTTPVPTATATPTATAIPTQAEHAARELLAQSPLPSADFVPLPGTFPPEMTPVPLNFSAEERDGILQWLRIRRLRAYVDASGGFSEADARLQSVIPALPETLTGAKGRAVLGVYDYGQLVGYQWEDGDLLPVARVVPGEGEHLIAVTPADPTDEPQIFYLILAADGTPEALVSAFEGNGRWQKWTQMSDHMAEFPLDEDLRVRLAREDELLALPTDVPFVALAWDGSLQPPQAEVNAFDVQGASLGTLGGQLDWKQWVLRDADSGAEIAWYWAEKRHWLSLQAGVEVYDPQGTPLGVVEGQLDWRRWVLRDFESGDEIAWYGPQERRWVSLQAGGDDPATGEALARLLVERLALLENTRYGLRENRIMVVDEHPAVRKFEAAHVAAVVPTEEAWSGLKVMTPQEAQDRGLDYRPLAPDVSAVEIADKNQWGVEENQLLYNGAAVGRFDGNALAFTAPDGTEVRVLVNRLQWDYTMTDDGGYPDIDKGWQFVHQRLVTHLLVRGDAPEGIEGEWMNWVYQEGAWYQVPEPENMVALYEGLKAGESVNDMMAQFRESLPEDWQDLPEIDEAVVDVYLAQQAQVWERVKEKFDTQVGFVFLPGFGSRMFRFMSASGTEINSWGSDWAVFSALKLNGDNILVSVPFWLATRGGGYQLLVNLLLDPKSQDEFLKANDYNWSTDFNSGVWQALRSGVGLDGGSLVFITSVNDWQRLRRAGFDYSGEWVERNNGLVPRGIVGADGELVRYWSENAEWLYPREIGGLSSGEIWRIGTADGGVEERAVSIARYHRWAERNLMPVVWLVSNR